MPHPRRDLRERKCLTSEASRTGSDIPPIAIARAPGDLGFGVHLLPQRAAAVARVVGFLCDLVASAAVRRR